MFKTIKFIRGILLKQPVFKGLKPPLCVLLWGCWWHSKTQGMFVSGWATQLAISFFFFLLFLLKTSTYTYSDTYSDIVHHFWDWLCAQMGKKSCRLLPLCFNLLHLLSVKLLISWISQNAFITALREKKMCELLQLASQTFPVKLCNHWVNHFCIRLHRGTDSKKIGISSSSNNRFFSACDCRTLVQHHT